MTGRFYANSQIIRRAVSTSNWPLEITEAMRCCFTAMYIAVDSVSIKMPRLIYFSCLHAFLLYKINWFDFKVAQRTVVTALKVPITAPKSGERSTRFQLNQPILVCLFVSIRALVRGNSIHYDYAYFSVSSTENHLNFWYRYFCLVGFIHLQLNIYPLAVVGLAKLWRNKIFPKKVNRNCVLFPKISFVWLSKTLWESKCDS